MSEIEFSFITPAGTRRTQILTIAGGDVPPATGARSPAMMNATPADPAVTIDLTSGIIKIGGHPIPGSTAQGPASAVQFAAASGSDFVFGGDSRFTFDPIAAVLQIGTPTAFVAANDPAFGQAVQANKSGGSGLYVSADNNGVDVFAAGLYAVAASNVAGQEPIAVVGDAYSYVGIGDTTPLVVGVAGFAGQYGLGETTTLIAIQALSGAKVSGTVNNNFGVDIQAQNGIGSTLNAALHIADQGAGANDYAIYVAGGKCSLLGPLLLPNMPTADPHVVGELYSVTGVVHVSAG